MRIKLNESQIKNLLGSYKNSLTEQTAMTGQGFNPKTKTQTVNLGSVFPAGKWKITTQQRQTMEPELRKIVSFLVKYPQSKLTIQIEAGESKVTNYDNESSPPIKVKEGYLSNKRGEEIAKYLDKFFKTLQSSGKITEIPTLPQPKTIVGGPLYTRGTDNPKDKKYLPHQFIKLVVSAETTLECLIGMQITIGYKSGGGHKCDEAIFDFKVNGVSLGVANLNNGQLDTAGSGKWKYDLKGRIDTYNKAVVEKEVKRFAGAEMIKYRKLTSKSYRYNGLDINGMRKELPKVSQKSSPYRIMMLTKEKELRDQGDPRLVIFDRTKDFTKEDLNKFDKFYGRGNRISAQIKKYIGKNMGYAVQKRDSIMKLQNIEGRYSDQRLGGGRSQTYILDNNKAKEIVAQSKIKDRLVMSIKPLVDKNGPYKQFFAIGSHSDVPYVEIIDGKGKNTKFSPNVKMDRGDTTEKPILQTTLCGKKIVS